MLGLLTCCGPSSDVSSVMAWVPGADPRGAVRAFHRAGQGSASPLTIFSSPGYTEGKNKIFKRGRV